MRKISKFLVAVVLMGSVAAQAQEYRGTFDEQEPLGMSLSFVDSKVTGSYFVGPDFVDRRLEGTVDDRKIQLDEIDAQGKVVASIVGTFPEADPKERFSGELQREVFQGTWKPADGSKSREIDLTLASEAAGEGKERYSNAGVADADALDAAALRFWKAVLAGDQKTVAAAIDYPVQVQIDGNPSSAADAEALLASYDKIFHAEFLKAIREAIPHHMFSRDQGVMLGNGEVWFNPEGKVIALNN